MNTKSLAILMLMLFLSQFMPAFADTGFSSNPGAIEQAAKSVLMLQVFDSENKEISTGSGFVAFNNRTIVTNYHVIDDAAWMIAHSDDGYQYMVTKVLITDKDKDIAICGFISPTDLLPLEFNTDGKLMRAEKTVAIGSPIGITNTVSLGNISALYSEEDVSWIQFTAPISHGSSGGALFDDNGKVIGITSASYIDTQNLNLAIHISEVEALYNNWDGKESNFVNQLETLNTTATPNPSSTQNSTPVPTITPNRYSPLKRGDSGAEVTKLKEQLAQFGYLGKSANDRFDFETECAVIAFNRQNFNESNKIADEKMQELLFEGSPAYFDDSVAPSSTATLTPYRELKKGDKGDEVKRLQIKLIELGYLSGSPDGIFGSQTETAVKEFNNQNFSISSTRANSRMQHLLFDGSPKPYREPTVILYFKDSDPAEVQLLQDNRLKIRFPITNKSLISTVKAFELYVYATDIWGNRINDDIYIGTTTKNIAPEQLIYSDYFYLPNGNKISQVFCAVHKIAYSDGTIYTVPDNIIKFSGWGMS